MTAIIGLSGRKQSGKGTLALFAQKNALELFGVSPQQVNIYSMAGPLKAFCYEVLGLSYAQCYGSDADKNTLTRYRWEDLPHYPRIVSRLEEELWLQEEERALSSSWWERLCVFARGKTRRARYVQQLARALAPRGFLTGRQVLQEVGTGIFRQMWADVWNQACLRAIARDNPKVALIDDIRFPDEADAVLEAGGMVYRLSRAPHDDSHISERQMEGYRRFSGLLDNAWMTREESLREFAGLLWKTAMTLPRPDWGRLRNSEGGRCFPECRPQNEEAVSF